MYSGWYQAILSINLQKNGAEIILGNGFTSIENNNKDFWAWSVWQESEFYVYNFEKEDKIYELNFDIIIPGCLTNQNLTIKFGDSEQSLVFDNFKKYNLSEELVIKSLDRLAIKFSGENIYCSPEKDPRDLYFSIKNLELTTKTGNYELAILPYSRSALYQK